MEELEVERLIPVKLSPIKTVMIEFTITSVERGKPTVVLPWSYEEEE